jgi:hypothetical protein
MMTTTTSSSISVNPLRRELGKRALR